MVDVIVIVPTFRRPRGLTRLLRALGELQTSAALSILVADNDAELRQGEQVCEDLRKRNYRWPLRSIIVAERGLSPVRNALFCEILKDRSNATFIAMLDDDEWPTNGAVSLTLTFLRFGASLAPKLGNTHARSLVQTA
jgi:glycosyltransferase involved in cell wall biosynthesis